MLNAEDQRQRRPVTGLPFVRSWFARYWLAVWFGIIFAMRAGAIIPGGDGWDARIYIEASRVWLAGGNPWGFLIDGNGYAAPPLSLIPVMPLTLLPPQIAPHVMVAGAAVSAVLTIRRLCLPWWWLLFPPLLDAVWNGTLDAYLVLLIVSGNGWLAAIAKIYAALPLVLLGRWRQIAILAVAVAVTAPVLPWAAFLEAIPVIAERFATQTRGGMSAVAIPGLIPVAAVSLVLLGRRAAWLAVPAIWPSTQWYYSVIALPALAASPLVAAAIAIPIPGLVVAGMAGQVVWECIGRRDTATRDTPTA